MKNIFRSNLFFLVLLILQLFAGVIVKPFVVYFNLSVAGTLVLSSLVTVFIPTTIYFLITRQSLKETLRLNKLGKYNFFASLGVAALCYPIASFCNIITSFFYRNNVGDVLSAASDVSPILFLIAFAVLPAVGEELIMRGVILSGYRKTSVSKAALMNGLLFAILHLNPPQFLYAFILGVVFSYLVSYTDSLYSSMLGHFLFNGTSSVFFLISNYLSKSGFIPSEITDVAQTDLTLTPTISMVLMSSIIAVICAIAIIELLKWMKKVNRFDEKEDFYNNHTVDLNREDTSEFKTYSPKLSRNIAYLPVFISVVIFLSLMVFTF